MHTDRHGLIPDPRIEAVVGAAFEVANILGPWFLEKVYERALVRELRLRGLSVRQQISIPVTYKGAVVGNYIADLLVENQLLVELKCVECFSNEHLAQCINYLKAARLRLALLINFQHAKLEWKRVVLGCIRVHP